MDKVANVENVVCSVETMSRHPELYHYTKPAAFEGIVGSQTLRCSHFREMIDTDELRLMRDLLTSYKRRATMGPWQWALLVGFSNTLPTLRTVPRRKGRDRSPGFSLL